MFLSLVPYFKYSLLIAVKHTFKFTPNGDVKQKHRVSETDTRDQFNITPISVQVFYWVTLVSNTRAQCYHYLSTLSTW